MPKYVIQYRYQQIIRKDRNLMNKYIETIKCKECGATLTNLAEFDCDEGFLCSNCGIEYDHRGKEVQERNIMDYQAIQLIEISKQLKRIANSLEELTDAIQED